MTLNLYQLDYIPTHLKIFKPTRFECPSIVDCIPKKTSQIVNYYYKCWPVGLREVR